jgi:hypothetical protein
MGWRKRASASGAGTQGGGVEGAGSRQELCATNEPHLHKGRDAVLLFLTNLRLVLDNVPELDDIILNLLDVDGTRNLVGTRHLFNVRLELAHILPVDFRIYDLTLLGDFGVGRGRESN